MASKMQSATTPVSPTTALETPEQEAVDDLAIMRGDAQKHLTPAVVQYVVSQTDISEPINTVARHLARCSWCRDTMRLTLSLSGQAADHLGYRMLEAAEDWERWQNAAISAHEKAREFLHSHNASVIYKRDGTIWEELPDGTTRTVSERITCDAAYTVRV